MATKTVCDAQGCFREEQRGDHWLSLWESDERDDPLGVKHRDFCSWTCLYSYVKGRA